MALTKISPIVVHCTTKVISGEKLLTFCYTENTNCSPQSVSCVLFPLSCVEGHLYAIRHAFTYRSQKAHNKVVHRSAILHRLAEKEVNEAIVNRVATMVKQLAQRR